MQFTGKIGDSITISGNNFYRISRVVFGNAPSNFEVIDSNNIRARVPDDASWDYINIVSDDRGISGMSSQKFAPQPLIESYAPVSGISGDSIDITGKAFSGVSGVTFNDVQAEFTVNSNRSITTTVPSGSVRGTLKLFGGSGLVGESPTDFSPEIRLIAMNPSSGFAGSVAQLYGYGAPTPMIISGQYFFEELMFTGTETGKYLVSFGSNLATGYFYKLNSGTLSGIAPARGIHGKVNVAREDSTVENVKYYDSNYASVNFTAIGEEPEIEIVSDVGAYSEERGNVAFTIKGKGIGTDFDGKNLTIGLIQDADVGTFKSGLGGGLVSIAQARMNEYNGELEGKNSAQIYHEDGVALATFNDNQFGESFVTADLYENPEESADFAVAFPQGKSIRMGSHYAQSSHQRDQNAEQSITFHTPKDLRPGPYRVAVERKTTDEYSNPNADVSVQPDHHFRAVSSGVIQIAGSTSSYRKDSDRNMGTPLRADNSEVDLASNSIIYYDNLGNEITRGVHKLNCKDYDDFISEGGWTAV